MVDWGENGAPTDNFVEKIFVGWRSPSTIILELFVPQCHIHRTSLERLEVKSRKIILNL